MVIEFAGQLAALWLETKFGAGVAGGTLNSLAALPPLLLQARTHQLTFGQPVKRAFRWDSNFSGSGGSVAYRGSDAETTGANSFAIGIDSSMVTSNNTGSSKLVLGLGILLGTFALSPSAAIAFLHSPPHVSHGRIPKDQLALYFYPSDETDFAERLQHVQDAWDGVKREGLVKFFSDEFDAAEKIVKGNADSAEEVAANVARSGAADAGKRLASAMSDLRQEFDELKAVQIVGEADVSVVRTVLAVEEDLVKVARNVATSVEKAGEAVRSAMAAATSTEGLPPGAKAELIDKLESTARAAEAEIKVADAVAAMAKQIATKNEQVTSQLANTGDRLSSAIDATALLAQQRKGTGAAAEAVSKLVAHASIIVKEELSAAAGIATAVGRKASADADAVAALDERATGAMAAVRAMGDALGGGEDATALSQLTPARDIPGDADVADALVAAMSKEVATDGEALGALVRSSSEVGTLMDAVNAAVNAAADVVAVDDEATAERIVQAVGKIEELARGAERSLEEVKKAKGKCEEYNVKKMMENTKEAFPPYKLSPRSTEKAVGEEEGVANIRVGHGRENEQSVAKLEEFESPHSEIEHEKMESAAPKVFASEVDSKHFEHDASRGETVAELPDSITTLANTQHFDSESASDVALSTVDRTSHAIELATCSVSSDPLAEAAETNGDPESFTMLLPSSDAVHDVVTSTTETLAKAMGVVLSFFS